MNTETTTQQEKLPQLVRAMAVIERAGNALPHPFWLFWTLSAILAVASAETTQALFRIADSGSTAITPMSPYFVMALGFLQRYRKSAGIGTLASYTLPLAVAMTVTWITSTMPGPGTNPA